MWQILKEVSKATCRLHDRLEWSRPQTKSVPTFQPINSPEDLEVIYQRLGTKQESWDICSQPCRDSLRSKAASLWRWGHSKNAERSSSKEVWALGLKSWQESGEKSMWGAPEFQLWKTKKEEGERREAALETIWVFTECKASPFPRLETG